MSEKRKLDEASSPAVSTSNDSGNGDSTALQAYKRARVEETALILSTSTPSPPSASSLPPRTSSLPAPTVRLTGHKAAVLGCKFSPSGSHLISAGLDHRLFLWSIGPQCLNTLVFSGHQGGVLDVAWRGETELVSASVDGSAALWDVETGVRVKRLRAHKGVVNAVAVGDGEEFVTGGDDGQVLMWDRRGDEAAGGVADGRLPGVGRRPLLVAAAALPRRYRQPHSVHRPAPPLVLLVRRRAARVRAGGAQRAGDRSGAEWGVVTAAVALHGQHTAPPLGAALRTILVSTAAALHRAPCTTTTATCSGAPSHRTRRW